MGEAHCSPGLKRTLEFFCLHPDSSHITFCHTPRAVWLGVVFPDPQGLPFKDVLRNLSHLCHLKHTCKPTGELALSRARLFVV